MSKDKVHINNFLGCYKSEEFIKLIIAWAGDLRGKRMLKTDLREEAYGEDEILFSLSNNDFLSYGVDKNIETVKAATAIMKKRNLEKNIYMTADIREIPFKDKVFDLIVSSSTLDHFREEKDFTKSLVELKRVLKNDGIMIITINNQCNLIFYFFAKLEQLFGLVDYPIKFYTLKRIRRLLDKIGLVIYSDDRIVSIINPLNSVLILMRRLKVADSLINVFAKGIVKLAKLLDKQRGIKIFTSWFIAIKCIKKTNEITFCS
ncbi:MAG: methyltransferase domain-containing protein [Candidatus Omnitrophica bacterium]|nr:methyltransferase domain-containing protein [Candidatus Omnitrophota bacterium]